MLSNLSKKTVFTCFLTLFLSSCYPAGSSESGEDQNEGVGIGLSASAENGLKAEYFNDINLTDKVAQRVDPDINFNWGRDKPHNSVDADTFSIRWTGFIMPKHSEKYTFYTYADDGMRIYIDNQLVVNDWSNHGARERSGTINLTSGKMYPITVEYYDNTRGATAKILWSSSTQSKEIIPNTNLFTEITDNPVDECPNDPDKTEPGICGCGVEEGTCDNELQNGLLASYFQNKDFSDLVLERIDDTINFSWGHAAPTSDIDSDTFSIRWTGFIMPKYSEKHTFYTYADDGMRIYIDNQLVVNDWSDHGARERSGTIELEYGKFYPITVEYYENRGGATAKMYWSSNRQSREIVPQANLFTEKNGHVDECPNDPDKTEPGICGCGIADIDSDSDGVLNCNDSCPQDPFKITPGMCGCGVPEGTCNNEDGNIALGKPTSQSSTAYRGDSSRAVDGNTSGIYREDSVTHTATSQNPWWKVDLLEGHRVERIIIYNRTDCCSERLSDFQIEYLNENGNIIKTYSYTGNAPEKTEIPLSSNGVYSLRIQLNGYNPLSLAEVEVYGFASDAPVEDQCPDDPSKTEPGECGCGVPEGTCGNNSCKSILMPSERLTADEYICSPNGQYEFGMDNNGDLLLLDTNELIWKADLSKPNAFAEMQTDGNFVVYNGDDPIFHTATHGNSGAYLVVEDNGRVSVKVNDIVLWSKGKKIPVSVNFDKSQNTKLRFASYNVLRDSIFDGKRKDSFIGVANAVDADIWCLQEVSYGSNKPASEGEKWLSRMRQITGNNDWKYSWDNEGRYLLSLHPIKWHKKLNHRVHATWINLPGSVSSNDLVVVNVHLAPGGSDRENARRDQASAAVDFLNQVKNGNYTAGNSKIPSTVNMVVCGDFNSGPNGGAHKIVESLDTRYKNDSFTDSYTPKMIDVKPLHLGTSHEKATHGSVSFSNDGSWDISGGLIDFVLFRSHDLKLENSFILNTLILDNSLLNEYGMDRAAVAVDPNNGWDFYNDNIACDHFPIIADFK